MNTVDSNLYQFPATRFISNTIWRQWWHMASELLEIAAALLRKDWQHAATEIYNLKHSGETGHHILAGMGADIAMAKEETLQDNLERGYYDTEISYLYHIHESYPWNCGAKTGIRTTNDKYVDCPACLALREQKQ